MAEQPVILHYLHRDNLGGGPKNVRQVIDALEGLGEQHVITAGEGRLCELLRSQPDVPLHKVSDVAAALFPVTVWQLAALVRKLRPAVILTHGQWGGMFMGMALKLAPPTRAVFVTQWCSLYESRDVWRAGRNWLAEWFAFSTHQQIVCASEGNVRQFLYAGLLDDRSRAIIIPNPIEPPMPVDEARLAALNPPARLDGVKTFVFLGRLDRQKRPDWLLKAWRQALDKGLKNARLLMFGGGSWQTCCEELIRAANLASSVQLMGYSVDAGLYLHASDALLLSSLYEGHANVVLEAMACGVPVIAMAADGVQESFTDGQEGFLVPLGDVQTMAEKILMLSQDERLRRSMAEKSRDKARRFNPEIQQKTYRQLVSEILAVQ